MKIEECNPFVRAAMIQPTVFEGVRLRCAYDHRLFYVLSGEGVLVSEAGETPIGPDTMMLFPPAFAYHFKGRMSMAVVNFDMTRRAAALKKPVSPPSAVHFSKDKILNADTLDGEILPFVGKRDMAVRQEVLSLVDSFVPEESVADAVTSAMLKRMLAELLGEGRYVSPVEELVRRIRRYIEGYATEIRDNAEIARAMGYHPVYLATVFKEHMGMTLHAAILARRVQIACRWLSQTDSSIEDIAAGTGFSSRSHFCTVFRAHTGLSPRAFRQKSGQG